MTVRNFIWTENVECKKQYISYNAPKKTTEQRCELFILCCFV